MKYFGTDGIRQKAEEFTPEFLTKVIKGLINYAGDEIKVILAGDTRESSEWIIQDLSRALESFGVEYQTADVLPTPAINYCFYQMGFDFAIDVTASHNPYTDNGIKIFERGPSTGQKLCTKGCEAIENALMTDHNYALASTTLEDDIHEEALELYLAHLIEYLGPTDFSHLKVGIDCANGATSVVGDRLFKQLGAEPLLINADSSYNTKINHNCGSTHLEPLIKLVTSHDLDFGIAYDGDGDRCLLVDHTGEIIDGDQIIAILATHLHLSHIAITVMANQGLLNWAKASNITTEITPVGDSNVAEAMRTSHIPIGGEQSGHIILPNEPTGDGILTSLVIAKIISDANQPLKILAGLFTKSPQIIVNFDATPEQKEALKEKDAVKQLLLDYSKKLESEHGRLLVRPSGTEPLIRITMWGDDLSTIETLADELKSKLQGII